jgi:hypothetical protein
VKVISVQDKLSVASTDKKERVNIGGVGIGTSAISQLFMQPEYDSQYETLKTEEKTWEDISEEESYVKCGDPVVQVKADLS